MVKVRTFRIQGFKPQTNHCHQSNYNAFFYMQSMVVTIQTHMLSLIALDALPHAAN